MGEGYKVDDGAFERTAADAHTLAAGTPGATQGMRLDRVAAGFFGART